MKVDILLKQVICKAIVESETTEGMYYKVTKTEDEPWECTCPDHRRRGSVCKHIKEVKEMVRLDE